MSVIKTFQGVGALIVQGHRHPGVRYHIDVSTKGHWHLEAQGTLTLEPTLGATGTAIQAFNEGNAELELETRELVQIVPTHSHLSVNPPSMTFKVSGPLPGFED